MVATESIATHRRADDDWLGASLARTLQASDCVLVLGRYRAHVYTDRQPAPPGLHRYFRAI